MEGVADRSAQPNHVIGVEGVIEDAVVVCLGANKEISPQAVANAEAGVHQELITVQMGVAGREPAVAELVIENHALATHASQRDHADPLVEAGGEHALEPGRVHGVDVIQEGAVGLVAVVGSLLVAKGNFGAVAETVLVNAVDADVGVHTTLLRRRHESPGRGSVLGGEKSAAANRKVKLLGTGRTGKRNQRTHGHKPRELSQIHPPFSFPLASRSVYAGVAASWRSGRERLGQAVGTGPQMKLPTAAQGRLVWTDSVSD